jgi:acetolactate synthase-1/2/3 large subunit
MTVCVTVGQAVVQAIRDRGVDTVFGIPGTHSLEFYRDLGASGVRTITTRHEQGAVFAADGWSQRTGRPGVVLATSGPGVLNTFSPAASAYCESRPLLIVSPGRRRGDPGGTGELHDTKDLTGAFGRIVEWSHRAVSGEDALDAVDRAFALFREGRPRPVHIEIPVDLMHASFSRSTPAAQRADARTERASIDAAVDALVTARRPIIVAGGGSTEAAASVVALAEALGAPVVTTVNGKGVLPEEHPLHAGSAIPVPSTRHLIAAADLLVVIGSKLGAAEFGTDLGDVPPILRLDIGPDEVGDRIHSAVSVFGRAASTVRALVDALPSSGPVPSWTDARRVREDGQNVVRSNHGTLSRIVDAIALSTPRGTVVAGDSSQITYLATTALWPSTAPHEVLYMPTFATLGYGLPAAIGAQLADPDAPVLALLGDGALMFSIQEIMTAVELRLPIVIVCVDNGGYGEIRQNMVDADIAPVAVDLAQPDWVALARAFGAYGVAADIDDIGSTVAAALQADGPTLVHLPIPSRRAE